MGTLCVVSCVLMAGVELVDLFSGVAASRQQWVFEVLDNCLVGAWPYAQLCAFFLCLVL